MHYIIRTCLSSLIAATAYSQDNHIAPVVDTSITTTHETQIQGKTIQYEAEIGNQPVWDKKGAPIATLNYTYYRRTNDDESKQRPLLISFNGGPGSASVWMHIAYSGPKLLNIDEEGFPVQPYGIKDNPHSVLDAADILFVNPVNTGFSRTIPMAGKEVDRDKFFGINADINYLAEWLNTFVSRHDRWRSPKYLVGESYGGTRVAGLALALQEQQWMYLNGVIMVSPADYKVFNSDTPISNAVKFPYYCATAKYYELLASTHQEKELESFLAEVEQFTLDKLIPALARGTHLSKDQKTSIAKKMAEYCGISAEEILSYNLAIPENYFWKAIVREEHGKTVGRLDSRYFGIDKTLGGDSPDYNAELSSWLHSFTPAINYYLREELGFKTDLKYNMFGDVHPWDRRNNNTRDNLRKAMAQNPYLNVLYQAGYYDGATTYFNTKYSMRQLDPSGAMKDRLQFKGYESGHMMYLRDEDLEQATKDLRTFILSTVNTEKPATYRE
ncbi:MAG: S10 family peptidase [Bacteroidota bacterium]